MGNGLTDEELAAIIAGGDEVANLGRVFVIDDQGTEGRLAWVTTSTGGSAFRLDPSLGGGIVPEREGQRVLAFVNPETGEPLVSFGGGTFLDPTLNQLVSMDATGNTISGATRNLPFPTAPGAGGLTFGQRRQLDIEAAARAAEEAEKQRQFTVKRDVASRAGALTRDLVGLREQARNIVTETFGEDVLRGSLAAQGALTIGTTPQRAQENVLRGVAAQPIPEALGPEASLAELTQREAELTRRTEGGLPRPRGPLGFAEGTKGTGHGMLVGEAGPEVVEFTPQGTVRVIPLTRKAKGGLEEFDPFAGVSTDLHPMFGVNPLEAERLPLEERARSIGRALEPGFRAAGFDDPNLIPLGRTGPFGQFMSGAFGSFGAGGLRLAPGQTAETFGQLGVRPNLLQAEGTNDFYSLTPEGELRKIGGLAELGQLGFGGRQAMEQVTVMPFSEILELGQFQGGTQTELPPAEISPFAARPTPIRLPLGVNAEGLPDRDGPSISLLAPRQMAGVWRTLDPDMKNLWLSGWELGGISREQVARELGFFTPRGTASQFATAALR